MAVNPYKICGYQVGKWVVITIVIYKKVRSWALALAP
jgi:hypothetical protein